MPMQHSKKIHRHDRNYNYIKNVALRNYRGKNKDTLKEKVKLIGLQEEIPRGCHQ